MFRSIDGGQSYTALTNATNGIPTNAVTSIVADPNNASRFFAGVVGQGVFRSDDGGANWNPFNTNLTNLVGSRVLQLTAHPGGGTTVLHVLISGPNPVAFTSNDGGANWNPLAATPAGFTSGNNNLYTGMASDQLAVDPTNAQIVYISKGYGGGTHIFRYNPAGAGSWVNIEGAGAAGGTMPHVDHRDLEFVGNNVLLSANDGGIYFIRNPQNAAANRWTSLHGRGANGLGATEYTNIAWDSVFDVATGGAQDNGTTVQNGAGDPIWTTYAGNDGGDVAVDTVNAGAGRVFRYSSSQNFGWLRRHTFDSANNQPVAAVDLFPAGGLANFTPYFVPPFVLNAINPARMVVGGSGTSPVYELTNAATAPNAAGATWTAVPIGAGFGVVNLTRGAPFAAGGRLNGVDNAEVLVVGSGSGVFVRSTAGGTLTATPTDFPGGTVVDIALDPENWQHFFVCDASRVYETPDAGNTWTELTLNRPTGNTALQSIEFVPTANGGVVLVGGNLGVSRLPLTGPNTPWTRFGLGLPNALVMELEYNATDDLLLAGTFGRGAWSVASASTKVELPGVLQIDGDTDFAGQDDVIRLIRNAANPLMLDVFLNSLNPIISVPLATLNQINVNGWGGNDTLVLDSINGLISVPGGTRYHGGTGFDLLRLEQNGGPTRTSDVYSVGPSTGAGTSVISDASGTQSVFFEALEPVIDLVPAATLVINATPAHNAISYTSGSLISNGKVLIDNFEPIEFSNKPVVNINASFGNDTIALNNFSTPTGLVRIEVVAGDGADTLSGTGGFALDADGGTGADLLDASAITGNVTLLGDLGNDTLLGGSGNDSIVGGNGQDLINPGAGSNSVNGGADADTFLVSGTDAADTIMVEHIAAGTLDTTVNASLASNAISNLERVRIEAAAGADDISIAPFANGGLGYTVLGGDPIGAPGDRLNIDTGGDAAAFTPGPENDAGSVVVDTTAPTHISFDEIEALSITGGPAIVNGTNGADAITIIARDASTHAGADGVRDFTVAVNASPELLFLDTANLSVNVLGGSDEIALRVPAPNNADWDVDVAIDGGPPSASDKLIVETPGGAAETINYAPSGSAGGVLTFVAGAMSSVIDIAAIEHLVYDGEGDGDTLNILGTAGDDLVTHTAGAGNDEGTFRVNTTLALAYQNLGLGAGAGVLNVDAGGGSGDEFVYVGTALGDTFTVNAAGAVALNARLSVAIASVNVLTLEGGGGDDKFTLLPAISASPYDVINFTGAESSAGDTAHLTGTAGDDAFTVSGTSISLGGKTVNMSGVEREFLAAGGGTDTLHYQSVAGYAEEIEVAASPVAGTGTITVPWLMSLAFTGAELVDVAGDGADGDTLAVFGTNDVDNVQIQADAVGTPAAPVLTLQNGALATLLTLTNYTGIQTLRVFTLDGADVVNVFTGPAIGRELFIDGGLPTAKKKLTDQLNIFYVFPKPHIVHSAATQEQRTGLVDLDYGTSRTLIQYADTEDFIIRRV
jgi:hypothetical protein